jgi:anti-sigma-K factor RskA
MPHMFRLMLPDYLDGTLPAGEREAVERHLQRCRRCALDLAELQESVSLLRTYRGEQQRTADEPEWDTMVDSIMEATTVLDRLGASRRSHSLAVTLGLWLGAHRQRVALGALAGVAAAFLVLILQPVDRDPAESLQVDAGQMADSLVNERVTRYFSTSRVLLTELTNGTPSPASGNLARERETSRELVVEARYLRRQPLDGYSAGVISDVERIMLTMANLPDRNPEGDLAMIQQGVDHRNLLFRLRMAEQAYRSRTIVRASGARQGNTP